MFGHRFICPHYDKVQMPYANGGFKPYPPAWNPNRLYGCRGLLYRSQPRYGAAESPGNQSEGLGWVAMTDTDQRRLPITPAARLAQGLTVC